MEDAIKTLFPATAANAVTVFNSLSWPRRELVQLPGPLPGAQALDSPAGPLYFGLVQAPALGYSYGPVSHVSPSEAASVDSLSDGTYVLENGVVRAVVDQSGALTSLILKSNGRETIAHGARATASASLRTRPSSGMPGTAWSTTWTSALTSSVHDRPHSFTTSCGLTSLRGD